MARHVRLDCCPGSKPLANSGGTYTPIPALWRNAKPFPSWRSNSPENISQRPGRVVDSEGLQSNGGPSGSVRRPRSLCPAVDRPEYSARAVSSASTGGAACARQRFPSHPRYLVRSRGHQLLNVIVEAITRSWATNFLSQFPGGGAIIRKIDITLPMIVSKTHAQTIGHRPEPYSSNFCAVQCRVQPLKKLLNELFQLLGGNSVFQFAESRKCILCKLIVNEGAWQGSRAPNTEPDVIVILDDRPSSTANKGIALTVRKCCSRSTLIPLDDQDARSF